MPSSFDTPVDRQLLAGLKARERIDGEAFFYGGIAAIGVIGVPGLEATLAQSGPTERYTATLTVRRAWFTSPPEARDAELLAVHALTAVQRRQAITTGKVPPAVFEGAPVRRYLVTGINADDPVAYEFQLLDR
jgi:hypothetical protein